MGDRRRAKEVEEARKNGTLPPEKDAEGNLINPHNPEYISKRPWYLGDSGPSLKHQSLQKSSHLLSIHEADELHARHRPTSKVDTSRRKWKKGACKNCGATTHKATECVERPRKVGAWKTNRNIVEEEEGVDVRSERYGKLAFDAKRDQWLGYDPKDHEQTIKRYDRIESKRREKRLAQTDGQKAHEEALSDSDYESDADSSDKEFRDKEGQLFTERVARQGGVGGAEMKTTVRNLRIREDTAKYLRNLDPNSAYYDPKTRSMRENPNPELAPEDTTFAGDNVVRHTGDSGRLAQMQMFAWEAHRQSGSELHPLADPSQAEFLQKQFEEKKQRLEEERKRRILDKYGGQEHLGQAPALGQSEQYVEYTKDGRVAGGGEKAVARSKYVEDVLENNHSSVWGSFFDRKSGLWGYKCCHSSVRNSYCTGEEGKRAVVEAASRQVEAREMLPVKESTDDAASVVTKRSEMYGENVAPELDDKKLRKALKRARKADETDERKRKYNARGTYEVDAEEMEAYKLTKRRGEDPMANVDGEELLE